MFTGIIESLGVVNEIVTKGTNLTFLIASPLSSLFKPDQSVSHNGVCLTVESIKGDVHQVTAIEETLKKTTLGNWKKGSFINLEQCLQVGGRLDGHFVQGHVDTTGTCTAIIEKNGSREFVIGFPENFAPLLIEKGSVCLDGISLTTFNITHASFQVAIIPYTIEHTNLKRLQIGDPVNLEFDVLGKYLLRSKSLGK